LIQKLHLKVTAYQWFTGRIVGILFKKMMNLYSYMLSLDVDSLKSKTAVRLLETVDNILSFPYNLPVCVLVTSADVYIVGFCSFIWN